MIEMALQSNNSTEINQRFRSIGVYRRTIDSGSVLQPMPFGAVTAKKSTNNRREKEKEIEKALTRLPWSSVQLELIHGRGGKV